MSTVSTVPPPGKPPTRVRMSASAVAHDHTDEGTPRPKPSRGASIPRPATPFNRSVDLPSSDTDGDEGDRGVDGASTVKESKVTAASADESIGSGGSSGPRRVRRISSSARTAKATSVISTASTQGSERTIRRVSSTISSARASSGLSDTDTLPSDAEPFRSVMQPLHRQTPADKLRSALRPPKTYGVPPYSGSHVNAGNSWKPLPPSPPDSHQRPHLPHLTMPDWQQLPPRRQDTFNSFSSYDMPELSRDLPTPSPSSWEDRPPPFKEPMRRGSTGRGRFDLPWSRTGSTMSDPRGAPQVPIFPNQCLDAYLRNAQIPKWDKWVDPDLAGGNESRFTSSTHALWNKRNYNSRLAEQRGDEPGGKAAVIARLAEAVIKAAEESDYPEVTLRRWEARRGFYDMIEDYTRKNIPLMPIQEAHQWGDQTFALPSPGFKTTEYYDPANVGAADLGLLGFVTGAILKTAVSALHMLRFNATSFTFHVLPHTVAPLRKVTALGHCNFERGAKEPNRTSELPDGCGTLVLINSQAESDRPMIVVVRPPWLIGSSEMRDFAKTARHWRPCPFSDLAKEASQVKLLQMHVYDECVENESYFFCVTNLKYWLFGHFNGNYDRCSVSPVMERKSRERAPSIMQTLTVWLVRAFDERPRDGSDVPEPAADASGTRALPSLSSTRDVLTPPQSPTPAYSTYPTMPMGLLPHYGMAFDPHAGAVLADGGAYPMVYAQTGSYRPSTPTAYPGYTSSIAHQSPSMSVPLAMPAMGQMPTDFAYSTTTYTHGHARARADSYELGPSQSHPYGARYDQVPAHGRPSGDKQYDDHRRGPHSTSYAHRHGSRTQSERDPWHDGASRRQRRESSGVGHGHAGR